MPHSTATRCVRPLALLLFAALSTPPLPAAAQSSHESVTLSPGDATSWLMSRGRAGGTQAASSLGSSPSGTCAGFIGATPNVTLTVTSEIRHLTLRARSRRDVTLVVNGPNGTRCNDDAIELHPVISGSFPPGTYEIYVGTYEANQHPRFALGMLEMPPLSGRLEEEEEEVVIGTPPPPAVAGGMEFRGAFEGNDVLFTGESHDEIYSSCLGYTGSVAVGLVDDVRAFERSMHNGPGFWTAEQLCSIAALNARPEVGACAVTYTGGVEDLSFTLSAHDVREARHAISRYVPALAASGLIDDVTAGGRSYHNGPGFWSPAAVVAMLAYSVEDPGSRIVARGDIEGAPFSFGADNSAQIIAQCEAYWDLIAPSMVDDITVNGTARNNGPAYWGKTEACMIVGSLASAP